MKDFYRTNIENQVLEIVNSAIFKEKENFDLYDISTGPVNVINNNSTEHYFSEIEIDFWKNSNIFIDAMSVIIFSQGKLALDFDKLEDWLKDGLDVMIAKAKQMGNGSK